MNKKAFSRVDQSILGQWWWTIDHWLLGTTLILILIGGLLSVSASPMVAQRIGLDYFFFVQRHLIIMLPAVVLMLSVSLLTRPLTRYMCWLLFFTSLALLVMTPLFGPEIKGSRRWISFMGFSLQASEFIKPGFAVISAWLFAKNTPPKKVWAWSVATGFYVLIAGLLMLQPDFGMTFLITMIWAVQIFLAGLPFYWIGILGAVSCGGVVAAYFSFPHITDRIDRFLTGEGGDLYQVNQSLNALKNGGLFGQGPGEGVIKKHLPDAHADFIFSVAGEEFGYILCIIIILLYLFIIIRCFYHLYKETDLFIILALAGIMMQYTLQPVINIASTLHLIPTKGMTLPFLSYGGSSLLAMSLSMGIILSLTRKNPNKPWT